MRAISKALGVGLPPRQPPSARLRPGGHRTTAAAARRRPQADRSGQPAGFAYGTDSWPMSITGSGAVPRAGHRQQLRRLHVAWRELGAARGGCTTGNFLAWAPPTPRRPNANYIKYHLGVGTGVYWYMGGPGVDPHYNGTTTEAYNWGAYAGGVDARRDGKSMHVPYPVIWADIEHAGDRARA